MRYTSTTRSGSAFCAAIPETSARIPNQFVLIAFRMCIGRAFILLCRLLHIQEVLFHLDEDKSVGLLFQKLIILFMIKQIHINI